MKRSISHALVSLLAAGTVVAAHAPAASATSYAPCEPGGLAEVCYDEVRETSVRYAIPSTKDGASTRVAHVAAYLDTYSVNVGPPVSVSCVTPVVNGVEQQNGCATLGLRHVSRIELVQQPVDVTPKQIDDTNYLYTVYVCEATLTVKTLAGGVDDAPVFAPCHQYGPDWWVEVPNGWLW